jgi:hypothetical protein
MSKARNLIALHVLAISFFGAGLSACVLGGNQVDRSEGTGDLSIDGVTQKNEPIVCNNHKSFEMLAATGSLAAYQLEVTIDSQSSATVELHELSEKAPDVIVPAKATVRLSSSEGPVGSLSGKAQPGPGQPGVPVDFSVHFRCSANGGGEYATASFFKEHERNVLFFTVDHSGGTVVDFEVMPEGDTVRPLPNVQLHGSNLPVGADGTFRLTAPVHAGDPTGKAFDGQSATIKGRLDRVGNASGTLTYPPGVLDGPVNWTATIAGPLPNPVFPHAALDTRLITAAEIVSDPAINLLYPGSTNPDGSPPGPPAVNAELPQDQWSHMDFLSARPAGGSYAEAHRELISPGSAYDMVQWYQSQLTAMGWRTTPDSNYGNVPGLLLFRGPHAMFLLSFGQEGNYRAPATGTIYNLRLREAAQDTVRVAQGWQPGAPNPPFIPCAQPYGTAVIKLIGTVSGGASTLCAFGGPPRLPSCQYPSASFVIGQTRFVIWGPPSANDGMTITDPQLRARTIPPVEPTKFTVSGVALHITGHFRGYGYDETADISTQCVNQATT